MLYYSRVLQFKLVPINRANDQGGNIMSNTYQTGTIDVIQPTDKRLKNIATFVRPAQHEYLFTNMRDSVQADVAEIDFPVGFKARYPFRDRRINQCYWLEVTVVHHSRTLQTIHGTKPGLILMHTITPPWTQAFGTNQYGRHYTSSELYQAIADDSDFLAGVPDEFKSVITPLQLDSSDDTSMLFFAPSIKELNYTARNENHTAEAWDYFKIQDSLSRCARRIVHDVTGSCRQYWTRSVVDIAGKQAWSVDEHGMKAVRNIFNGAAILTACAITKD